MNEFDKQRFKQWHDKVNNYYTRAIRKRVSVKLNLPSVTLICADGIHIDYSIPALERCKELCNFGSVKLLTNCDTDYLHRVQIEPLPSLNCYSVFMLKNLIKYVETEHVLVVQHDGWILNPESWDPDWLLLDYVGPLFIHNHVIGSCSVGSGGFSLRSRRLISFVSQNLPEWDGTPAGADLFTARLGSYEDGVISISMRKRLLQEGFLFGTPEQASRFAQGGNNDLTRFYEKPFGFHGLWSNVDHVTGIVQPPPFGVKR